MLLGVRRVATTSAISQVSRAMTRFARIGARGIEYLSLLCDLILD